MSTRRAPIPVSFFSIPVGLLAFANTWHVGARLWRLPEDVAMALSLSGLSVWALLLVLYARKWFTHRAEAIAEARHPVLSSFVALVPVASMLAAQALLPWSRDFASALYVVTLAAQLAVGLWLNGRLWMGGRPPELVTPAIYLPSVAQSFVAATLSVAFGWTQLGMLLFGVGLLAWLALESMILQRASVGTSLPVALRPLLGIQLAPAVVGRRQLPVAHCRRARPVRLDPAGLRPVSSLAAAAPAAVDSRTGLRARLLGLQLRHGRAARAGDAHGRPRRHRAWWRRWRQRCSSLPTSSSRC